MNMKTENNVGIKVRLDTLPSGLPALDFYLELNPHSSLDIHNRLGGIENLTQIKGSCVMIVFNVPHGNNHKLSEGDKLRIEPEGTWHIHSNPFDKISLTHWYFDGDIRKIIGDIKKGIE